MSTKADLYPMAFNPIYKEKIWGGRSLEQIGRNLPGDITVSIGESWELADLATTSVSGGGGSAEYSVVVDGPLAGQTIRQLIQAFGQELLGQGKASDDGGFPLLIKFLDANENLSVQVHPSPQYAAAHPGAYLKSEAWYIVDAKPGSVIYKGLTPGTTPKQLRDAIATNTDQAMVPLLRAVPAKKGECHYLPSGTLHALGAGVLVAEVQTPSDTTYRVYDWGRTDRELHIEQAMACIDFTPEKKGQDPASTPNTPDSNAKAIHIQTKAVSDFFRIEELSTASPDQVEGIQLKAAEVWMGLEGEGTLVRDTGEETPLIAGQTRLLPASLGEVSFACQGPGRWLRVTLPTI